MDQGPTLNTFVCRFNSSRFYVEDNPLKQHMLISIFSSLFALITPPFRHSLPKCANSPVVQDEADVNFG